MIHRASLRGPTHFSGEIKQWFLDFEFDMIYVSIAERKYGRIFFGTGSKQSSAVEVNLEMGRPLTDP
jgi:hypothetical protein